MSTRPNPSRRRRGELTDRAILVRSTRELRGEWGWIGIYGLLALLSTPLALLAPVPLAIAVDSAIGGQPLPGWLDAVLPGTVSTSHGALVLACIMQVAVVVALQSRSVASTWVQTSLSERVTLNIRARMLAHAQQLSFRFHDNRGTADSVYRIQYDAGSIPSLATVVLIPFVSAIVTLVSMIVVVARLDPQLAAVAMLITPLLFLLTRIYRPRLKRRYKHVKRLESNSLKIVQEVFAAFRVVKAFGREDEEEDRYRTQALEAADAKVDVTVQESLFGLLSSVITAFGTALVLYLGVNRVRSGELTVGALLLVLSYLSQLYGPLSTISKQSGKIQSQLASAERVIELFDEVPEVQDAPGALPLEQASGAFRFDRVCFGYDADTPVLRDVDLEVPAGAKIGIVGRTGAGKSTLMNLLIRFYDPTSGRILLDGVDLRDYRVRDLRDQFSMVLQDPFLFSTTILDNIRYARPEASLELVAAATRAAGIDEFVDGLPEGYDTVVGERGMRLSGGERQRISLARAFLKNAPILLLDEPTSSVDTETETSIMDAMERLMHGRTTFMIAHRLSTLDGCDLVLRVEDGNVRPLGSPADAHVIELRDRAGAGRRPPARSVIAEPGPVVLDGTESAAREAAWAATALVPGFNATDVQSYPGAEHHSSAFLVTDDVAKRRLALKRQHQQTADVENTVYRDILPGLSVASVWSHGVVPSPSSPGQAWLATDHVSGQEFDRSRPEHRTALARWIGSVHVRAVDVAAVRRLPDHGPDHWRGLLEQASAVMDAASTNGCLTPGELANIAHLRHYFEQVLTRWPEVTALLSSTPQTLTHGDLTEHSIRLAFGDQGPRPQVFDWETAGSGSPMIDLGLVDLHDYHSVVASAWPKLSYHTLCRLRALGSLVWTAYVIVPEAANLSSEWPHRAAAKLGPYLDRLSRNAADRPLDSELSHDSSGDLVGRLLANE